MFHPRPTTCEKYGNSKAVLATVHVVCVETEEREMLLLRAAGKLTNNSDSPNISGPVQLIC